MCHMVQSDQIPQGFIHSFKMEGLWQQSLGKNKLPDKGVLETLNLASDKLNADKECDGRWETMLFSQV